MQTIFAKSALLPQGWASDVEVTIDANGRIAGVKPDATPASDAIRVPVLLAAPSNLHSHTFQRAMAGLAESRGPSGRDSFWTWREIMYRFLDILSPDEIEAIAAFAFMEMQECGFAAVAEFHYLHHRPGGAPYDDLGELSARIAAAADGTGIGLTLLPVHYARGGVDGRALGGGQLRFGNEIDRFRRLTERAATILDDLPGDTGMGVAPHSLRAVPAADLALMPTLLPGRPVHMHIAEQEKEIDQTMAVYGQRPMEWLLENAPVDERWCLIHCTHMTPEETEALAASGAVAGLCPVTEGNLGDGLFEGDRYLSAGGRFGIGSDSNILISVNGELKQFEYSQRLRDRARVVVAGPNESAGRVLWDKALAGGAQALGREAGAIEAGRWADLVALDPKAGGFGHLRDDRMLDGFIFTADRGAVSDLWSAGRHQVKEGRHVARDAIAMRYHACLGSIMDRL